MNRIQELKDTRSKINAEIDFLEAGQLKVNASDNRGQSCDRTMAPIGRERSEEEIINDLFTYHPPQTTETLMKYDVVGDAAKHLALVIWKACP